MQKQKIIQAFSGNLIEVAVGFTTILFITRNYPQEEAGAYFIVMALVAILNNLKEGFLQNGFIKYYVEAGRAPAVLKSGSVVAWGWDLINLIVFLISSIWLEELRPFLPFYLVQVIGYSQYRWVFFVHKSDLRLGVIFRTNLMVLVISFSGLLLVYLWELPITYCLLVAGVAYGLATFSFAENRKLQATAWRASFDVAQFRQLAGFGKYGLLKEVAGSISHHSGIFLSAYFLTLNDTAMLGLANRYAILIAIPGNSLSSLIYPILLKVGVDPKELRQAASQGIGKMYALLIPMCMAICVTAPALMVVLHGSEYLLAAFILIARVMLTTFLLPLGTGFGSIMNVLNQPGRITRLVAVTSTINIVAMVLLMPWMGIGAAVLAPAITEIVGFVIMRKDLSVIQLRMSDIRIQVAQYWRYWWGRYAGRWFQFSYTE